jgi:hypothetical protein
MQGHPSKGSKAVLMIAVCASVEGCKSFPAVGSGGAPMLNLPFVLRVPLI